MGQWIRQRSLGHSLRVAVPGVLDRPALLRVARLRQRAARARWRPASGRRASGTSSGSRRSRTGKSEFLQLAAFTIATAYLVYAGSSESPDSEERIEAKLDALLEQSGGSEGHREDARAQAPEGHEQSTLASRPCGEAATCTRCPLYERNADRLRRGSKGRNHAVSASSPEITKTAPVGRSSDWLVDCCARCSPRPDRRGRDVRHQRRAAFPWRPRGTRRIHDKPSWSEVQACGHWLSLELVAVRPTPRRLSWRDGRAVALRPLGAGRAPRRTAGASRRVEGARHDPSLRRPACGRSRRDAGGLLADPRARASLPDSSTKVAKS